MKKLLSILLLGSIAIAQAGFTDYLQSGWQKAKSAANYLKTEPAVIGAGIGLGLGGLTWARESSSRGLGSTLIGRAWGAASEGALLSLLNLGRAFENGNTVFNKERLRRTALYGIIVGIPAIAQAYVGNSDSAKRCGVALGSLVLLDTIVSYLFSSDDLVGNDQSEEQGSSTTAATDEDEEVVDYLDEKDDQGSDDENQFSDYEQQEISRKFAEDLTGSRLS